MRRVQLSLRPRPPGLCGFSHAARGVWAGGRRPPAPRGRAGRRRGPAVRRRGLAPLGPAGDRPDSRAWCCGERWLIRESHSFRTRKLGSCCSNVCLECCYLFPFHWIDLSKADFERVKKKIKNQCEDSWVQARNLLPPASQRCIIIEH